MRLFALLALALICSSTFALESTLMEKYAFAFKSRRSIMTVMTQIEEQLRTQGPMDAITNILNDFEQEIKDEQVAHQSLFDRQTDECEDEVKFRDGACKEANDAIDEATNSLESCTGQQKRAESDLKLANEQLSSARTSLGSLNRKKIQWDYSFETNLKSTTMAIDAFPEIFRILDELDNGGASLVQLTSHLTRMVPDVAKSQAMEHMNGLLATLAQVTMAATTEGANDKAAVEKIRSMCTQMLADLKAKKKTLLEDDSKFQKHFTVTSEKLKKEIERLTELIVDLEAEIEELKNCVSVQTSNLMSAKNKFARNDSLRTKAKSMCDAMALQYKKATDARYDELELLAAIKIKVMERYGQISKGATERGEMSADELKEYDQLDYESKDASRFAKEDFKYEKTTPEFEAVAK